jgi:hypothetical protein
MMHLIPLIILSLMLSITTVEASNKEVVVKGKPTKNIVLKDSVGRKKVCQKYVSSKYDHKLKRTIKTETIVCK